MAHRNLSHWVLRITYTSAIAALLAACGANNDSQSPGGPGASGNGSGGLGVGQGGSTFTGAGTTGVGGSVNGTSGANPGGGMNPGTSGANPGGGASTTGGMGTGGSGPMGCGKGAPAGNRCAAGAVKAAGTDNLIDDFEAQVDASTCHLIKAADGRDGNWNWGKDTMSPNGSVTVKFEAPGTGGKAGSTKALHAVGTGLNGYGGYVAVPLAPCYDASAYKGISFWLKGNVGGAPYVKVSIATPKTVPLAEGGDDTCMTGQLCYNHFTVQYFRVSDVWTRYSFTWAQLSQGWDNSAGVLPRDYQPQKEITGVNFAPVWPDDDPAKPAPGKSFDFSLDDVSFDLAGPYSDNGFKSLVSEGTFNGAFPGYNAGKFGNPYQMIAATLEDPRLSRIAREGSLDDRKREIAAMMAHMKQETGGLTLAEEIDGASKNYCMAANTYYPCSGGQGYYGRGPLQLSWNYNYGQAGEFFATDFGWSKAQLLGSPGEAIATPEKAWKTSMFFWMAWKNQDKNYMLLGLHYRFLREGFGATIRAINGALECPSTQAAENRRASYQQFCTALGVGNCNQNLACPAM
jgi:chitinase